ADKAPPSDEAGRHRRRLDLYAGAGGGPRARARAARLARARPARHRSAAARGRRRARGQDARRRRLRRPAVGNRRSRARARRRLVARMLDVEPERVLVDQVGLNHLTWVRAVHVDGDDVLPDLLAERAEELAESVDLPPSLLERLGVIPSYYLRYFYFHDRVLEEQLSAKPRAAEVAEIEHELLELYRDPALTTKPALLERRGGAHYSEAATQLVAALATGSGDVQVVDLRNDGHLGGP